MISEEILKKLDNFQLYELLSSNSFNEKELRLIEEEFSSRNVSNDEISRFQSKTDVANRREVADQILQNEPNPLLTPFLAKRHFRNIATLKAQGNFKKAKSYSIKLNIGLIIQGVIVVGALYLYNKK